MKVNKMVGQLGLMSRMKLKMMHDNDDGVEGKLSLYWFDTDHIYHQIYYWKCLGKCMVIVLKW